MPETEHQAEQHHPSQNQSAGRSPWLFTTIILGALVLGLLAQNTMLIGTLAVKSAGDIKIAVPDSNQPSGNQPAQQPDNNQPARQGSVKIDLGDAPVRGNANAPLTIVEFSDFQCPFCERFFSATLPSIEKDYVDTGKVKLVYKHFPLSFHENAEPAAIASECAKEQGKFWEFHDKLFSNQDKLGSAAYSGWAKDLGLDVSKFDSCVSSAKYKQDVQADFSQGSGAGVSGTPTFLIGTPEKGYTTLVGAQPYAAFKQAIDSQLNA